MSRAITTTRVYEAGQPLSERDLAGCLAAFDSNTPRSFVREERADYERFLAALPGPYWVVREADRVIAAGGFAREREDASRVSLCWGLVHRDAQGLGHGARLIEERLDVIDRRHPGCTVAIITSQHTQAFFARYGFEAVKITPSGLAPGLDEWIMRRPPPQ
ncbi:MAG: GNAT family N-acetyltransferase [Polyangiaceae bacterium]|nr:GNAT family N-acetyltransferase [Polyangiaceae bacterium]MCW5790927.1 GNAT family N-acetyltransferase [Polyangiaceae bacterium]